MSSRPQPPSSSTSRAALPIPLLEDSPSNLVENHQHQQQQQQQQPAYSKYPCHHPSFSSTSLTSGISRTHRVGRRTSNSTSTGRSTGHGGRGPSTTATTTDIRTSTIDYGISTATFMTAFVMNQQQQQNRHSGYNNNHYAIISSASMMMSTDASKTGCGGGGDDDDDDDDRNPHNRRVKTTLWMINVKWKVTKHICMVVILILITIQFHWNWNKQVFYTTTGINGISSTDRSSIATGTEISRTTTSTSIHLKEDHPPSYDLSSRSSVTSSSTDSHRKGEVIWEWKRFHQSNSDIETTTATTTNTALRRNADNATTTTTNINNNNNHTRITTNLPSRNNLLISQYDSGSDVLYGTLLNLTSRVNIAYAKKYSFDYVSLHGIAYQTIFDTTIRIPKPSRATYSKVLLVQAAMQLKYDYLLILDSDAMMYDFDRDVSLLIPDHKMVMAHQVHDFDKKQYYNINVGVILFNLHHPMLRRIVWLWNIVCFVQVMIGVSDNDQNPIQRILQAMGAQQLIEGNRHEFAYNNGTFIKHFKRVNSKSWTDDHMDNRISEIQSTVHEVCSKYAPICSSSTDASSELEVNGSNPP